MAMAIIHQHLPDVEELYRAGANPNFQNKVATTHVQKTHFYKTKRDNVKSDYEGNMSFTLHPYIICPYNC